MKHFGSILEFTEQRNADIVRACRQQLADADNIVMPEIFRRAAESPARRFWVSEERAAIVVSRILAGKPLPKMRASKRRMFFEIYYRFIAIREIYPHKPYKQLITDIVNQPAPEFYLTPRTMGELYYRIIDEYYHTK